MEQTDFGQIEIYNTLFENIDEKTIKYSPIECIEKKLSYCCIYNDRELPIMVGSRGDADKNPLKIKGYFIIDGICKSVNNIKMREKISFSKDRSYLKDGSRIDIKNMFQYTISNKNKSRKWRLPINWKDILKYTKYKNELESHLSLIFKLTKSDKVIKNEIDLITICYMFECWLGLREEPPQPWRLITAGELIYDIINKKEDVISCFRNNLWSVKYIKNVNIVSEDMKHYNLIGDIESIRRITIPTQRENTNMNNRMINKNDKYKICPVQTSDGSLCGTVMYLCNNAKITSKLYGHVKREDGDIHTFINSEYIGKTSYNFINKLKERGDSVFIIDMLCYIFNLYGRIIEGDLTSYTASLIPYKNNNPPIRSMFTCSMMKQAITNDNRLNINLINNTKTLICGDLGHTINIAIMPWYGFNIEDSIVINKSTSIKFRSRKCTIYRENNCKIISKYVKLNSIISKGQILYKTYNPKEVKTINIVYSEVEGIVEELIHRDNYFKLVIIKIRDLEVGDKMTSRHGQKGIVSLIEKDENMPYYFENGVRKYVDLIINPHAFPSRMTMGQIKEMGNNEHTVYINNIKVKNNIIVGKCLYMALRHQVDDKIQYRNSGNLDIITKQPVSGKKNIGGIRFGQMERDILIGLGAWDTLKELWSIDKITIYVCPKTGKINTNCCKEERSSHQYFKICLAYLRALGYDILLNNDKYSIIKFNCRELKKTSTLKFGDLDPLDLRLYRGKVVLPLCLRSNRLNNLYVKNPTKEKEIEKEIKRLLKSKDGAFHRLVEGHRIDKCLRSVIIPNPKLPIDTIEIPLGANIGTSYGILNRQPSLNVDSIKLVKLVQGRNKTIAFNPLLCKSFNADFDGDEMNVYGVNEIEDLKNKINLKPSKTQDYILGDLKEVTLNGLTANKKGLISMVEGKSKGQSFNLEHIYDKIGHISVNKINIGNIENNYLNGLTNDEWYLLCMTTRESAASIGVNTPITGHLESICNQMYI